MLGLGEWVSAGSLANWGGFSLICCYFGRVRGKCAVRVISKYIFCWSLCYCLFFSCSRTLYLAPQKNMLPWTLANISRLIQWQKRSTSEPGSLAMNFWLGPYIFPDNQHHPDEAEREASCLHEIRSAHVTWLYIVLQRYLDNGDTEFLSVQPNQNAISRLRLGRGRTWDINVGKAGPGKSGQTQTRVNDLRSKTTGSPIVSEGMRSMQKIYSKHDDCEMTKEKKAEFLFRNPEIAIWGLLLLTLKLLPISLALSIHLIFSQFREPTNAANFRHHCAFKIWSCFAFSMQNKIWESRIGVNRSITSPPTRYMECVTAAYSCLCFSVYYCF